MSDESEELAEALYRELEATEDLPIDRKANRWLGEAQAVAEAIRDVSGDARHKGARDVVRLLSEVERTNNDRADEHVERAKGLAERLAQT
ncbi:hypothetical protein [Halalkalicoccus subterraneus]|uniref:hypothetical protein n=1 Tax=Halalkalicoccus subterraneus TaxID=2675002 RepID=UPI000EFCBFC3|nr:hypothetical protein [Halalkalicoccus subterraneus]